MSVQGDLTTMTLEELLQWVAAARRTGTLEIKRDNVRKSIMFREGRVIACSSDDPTSLLGQFLLARGQITKEVLTAGLSRQEATGENLGKILVDMGALTSDEVTRFVEAKVEETVYGLFDWLHGQFRFTDHVELGTRMIDVDMSVENILLKGAQRYDEARRIREVFYDRGIVLARTDVALPSKIAEKPLIKTLLDLVDGERTLAELLLHAHVSEFLVTKFLYQLHKGGIVQIKEVRMGTASESTPGANSFEPLPLEKPEPESPGALDDITLEIAVARRLTARNENEAALEVLAAAQRVAPDHEGLEKLVADAEAACLADAQDLAPTKIPVRVETDLGKKGLSPTELFLLTLIDGATDIKSILWVVPMSAVDALRNLRRLSEKNIIELQDHAAEPPSTTDAQSSVA